MDRELLAEIAYRYYVENLTQNEIADILKINRSTISRSLKKAREQGIIKFEIDTIDPEIIELKNQILQKYNLDIIEISSHKSSASNSVKNNELYYHGARVLRRFIQDNLNIGVAWGETIGSTIHNIKPKITHNTTFVPIAGGPSKINTKYHINTLVYKLANDFNGKSIFINATAIQESKDIKQGMVNSKYFDELSNYWKNLDIAIIGIGGILSSYHSRWRDLLTEEDFELLKLDEAIGDCFCRFFNKDGNFIKNHLTDRTISINIKDFKIIPQRIGIARGENKVSAIKALLNKNILTTLITDKETAIKLLDN